MNKTKLLKLVRKLAKKEKTNFNSTDVDLLFHEIEKQVDIPFSMYGRSDGGFDGNYWLQVEYYSKKIKQTIIWNYDVGNFDDADELTDFIINTSKEVKNFERKLTNI